MAEQLPAAKISDLTVEIDSVPVDTSLGEVAWATVAITYVSGGVEPTLVIRVPVPWSEQDKEREALRRAPADRPCLHIPRPRTAGIFAWNARRHRA